MTGAGSRPLRLAVAVAAAGLLAACHSSARRGPPDQDVAATMTVSSPAFAAGGAIPDRFTCHGSDVSPPLAWSRPPAGTVELALVVDDPDAPGGTFVHWVVAHVDRGARNVAEGAVPAGGQQLPNSTGRPAWSGPCPPGGPAHHYRFTLYALTGRVDVDADADPSDSVAAIEAGASASGRLVATFSSR